MQDDEPNIDGEANGTKRRKPIDFDAEWKDAHPEIGAAAAESPVSVEGDAAEAEQENRKRVQSFSVTEEDLTPPPEDEQADAQKAVARPAWRRKRDAAAEEIAQLSTEERAQRRADDFRVLADQFRARTNSQGGVATAAQRSRGTRRKASTAPTNLTRQPSTTAPPPTAPGRPAARSAGRPRSPSPARERRNDATAGAVPRAQSPTCSSLTGSGHHRRPSPAAQEHSSRRREEHRGRRPEGQQSRGEAKVRRVAPAPLPPQPAAPSPQRYARCEQLFVTPPHVLISPV